MATDFFERQAVARRNTTWLVFLFVVGVVLMVGAVVGAAVFGVHYAGGFEDSFRSKEFTYLVPLLAGAATLVLILGGTLLKVAELRSGGGTAVAESLGGRLIFPNEAGRTERKVLNVVEEMAIASGVPTPPVYLLQEDGINAFAAGFSPSDAVIGVTRGCAETLSRDELQGVIAHEFSHIINGDMRMNIRLIGILYGILLLGLIGRIVLRTMFYAGAGHHRSRSNRNDNNNNAGGMLAIAAIAIVLIIVGAIGTLIGGLIKAAVSRQREFLADASAVQFTRNPGGIGGALKRIGGAVSGSKLTHPRASEVSHMYFAQGIWEGFTSLMATHPPLSKRIRAIDPSWNGQFPVVDSPPTRQAAAGPSPAVSAFAGASASAAVDEVPVVVADQAVEQIGEPTDDHRKYAAKVIDSIDPRIRAAARDPYGARAVLYGLLIDRDLEVRAKQFAELDQHAERGMADLTRQLLPGIVACDTRARLPIVDMALPALRALSETQYPRFRECFTALVKADNRLGLFEWTLSQVMIRHLRPQFERVRPPGIRYYGLQKLGNELSVLLSTLAYAGHPVAEADAPFADAARLLPETNVRLLPADDCGLNKLDDALRTLATVAAKHRGAVIDACAASICSDGKVEIEEAELLRGISDLLDCPMPPLLPGQKV